MFNSYETKWKDAEEVISVLRKEAVESAKDHKREIGRLMLAHEDEVARTNANVDTKITEKTNELQKQVSRLESEKAIALKEVSMYERAFENLGFDVKDMKEILNKLVDGLVSKNQIQLIGSKNK